MTYSNEWIYDNASNLIFEELGGDAFFETYYAVVGYFNDPTWISLPEMYTDERGHSYPVCIRDGAFENCTSLKTVYIPHTADIGMAQLPVAYMGQGVFNGCTNLANIYCADNASDDNLPAGWPSNWKGTTGGGKDSNGRTIVTQVHWDYLNESSGSDDPEVWEDDYLIYEPIDEATCAVSGFKDNTAALVIPSSFNGRFVTVIYDAAFYGYESLTSVVLGNKVELIGGSAFENCSALETVIMPNSVTEIGMAAFSGCTSLKTLKIPDSVTNIGELAFSNCSSLTSIEIPSGVETIYVGTFSYLSSLKKIILSNGIKKICSNAFEECHSLVEIRIPNSVEEIEFGAFVNCNSLIKMTIPFVGNKYNNTKNGFFGYIFGAEGYADNSNCVPESLKTVIVGSKKNIGQQAFRGCNSIETISLSDDLTEISTYAFYGCSSLKSINIPESLTSIGQQVFQLCSSLLDIVIPDGVTSIGQQAFKDCSSLESVEIPASVTTIGSNTFNGCTSLTKVNYTGTIDQWAQISFGNAVANPLYYANNLYINNELVTEIVLSVETITKYGFYNCTSLIDIVIADSVKTISGYAFMGCESATSITIGNNVRTIGGYAFKDCKSLTCIVIPESVTSIAVDVFTGCDSLLGIIMLPSTPPHFGASTIDAAKVKFYCVTKSLIDEYKKSTNFNTYAFMVYDMRLYFMLNSQAQKTHTEKRINAATSNINYTQLYRHNIAIGFLPESAEYISGIAGFNLRCISLSAKPFNSIYNALEIVQAQGFGALAVLSVDRLSADGVSIINNANVYTNLIDMNGLFMTNQNGKITLVNEIWNKIDLASVYDDVTPL